MVVALRSHLSGEESWGVESAVRILRAIATTRRLRRAIEAIAAINFGAVSILQNQLFIFEDVARIDDREFQVLLGRVDNQTLARAMKDASDAVRDRFLGNMSVGGSPWCRRKGKLLEELTEEEADIARKRVLETLRQLYEDGYIQTYFGSVQARHGPDEDDAADDIEMEEGELTAETNPEEPPPIYVPAERETAAAAKQAPSRKRFAYLVAAGCVAGAVLVTIGVLHFAMRDQPRTLQKKKRGTRRREI